MNVAILTPAADQDLYIRIWSDWYQQLEQALAGVGLKASPHSWTEPLPQRFEAVLPMIAWGYHASAGRWLARLEALEAEGQRMINPAAVLRWNTDKAYLAELEARGAPVVPTLSVDSLTPDDIEKARARFASEIVIAKPRISGGSHQTLKLAPGDSLAGGPTGPALVQPFLPAVSGEGELSMLYFGGVFSHSVAKVAAPGDFRVQIQFGGQSRRVDPWPGALEVAEQVLAAVPPLTYARIDLIRGPDGGLKLMELEAIEPDLFLNDAPEAGARFAAAVRAELER
jgi:glutathione synthase/RimK-type ligase-like ATP-grasp enzyme